MSLFEDEGGRWFRVKDIAYIQISSIKRQSRIMLYWGPWLNVSEYKALAILKLAKPYLYQIRKEEDGYRGLNLRYVRSLRRADNPGFSFGPPFNGQVDAWFDKDVHVTIEDWMEEDAFQVLRDVWEEGG